MYGMAGSEARSLSFGMISGDGLSGASSEHVKLSKFLDYESIFFVTIS